MNSTITNLHFFNYTKHRFWAFTQMQLAHRFLSPTKGLVFYKLLGTGSGHGFSLWPDFSTYALLTVWESEQDKHHFTSHNKAFLEMTKRSHKQKTIELLSIHSHGSWSGQQPFKQKNTAPENAKIGIITRATLRPSKLLEFWRHVPQASKAIKNAKGVKWYKGIGEWPFVQQATFSVWDHQDSVMEYAYKDSNHASIVKKTKKRKWYKEDMFARFAIVKISDT